MFGAHIGPVASFAPAFGMIRSVLVSLATLTIAMATPECTVPTTTSTFSRPTSRFMLSVAASGFELVVDLHEVDLRARRACRRSARP